MWIIVINWTLKYVIIISFSTNTKINGTYGHDMWSWYPLSGLKPIGEICRSAKCFRLEQIWQKFQFRKHLLSHYSGPRKIAEFSFFWRRECNCKIFQIWILPKTWWPHLLHWSAQDQYLLWNLSFIFFQTITPRPNSTQPESKYFLMTLEFFLIKRGALIGFIDQH